MNIATASDDFVIGDLEWPKGAPDGLPTEVVLSIPYHLLDDAQDDELDDYIADIIHAMVGVCPLDTFSFEPVE
jgi:hypothetical protein